MFAVGSYTLAPWKVVWPWISTGMRCACVSKQEHQIVAPEHNTSFTSFTEANEAHFFCALLGSGIADTVIRTFNIGGGGGIASPKVIEHIAIPKYKSNNALHCYLANLSERCHDAKAIGDEDTVAALESEMDEAAAQLWGITNDELMAIQDALKEMAKPKRKSSRRSKSR